MAAPLPLPLAPDPWYRRGLAHAALTLCTPHQLQDPCLGSAAAVLDKLLLSAGGKAAPPHPHGGSFLVQLAEAHAGLPCISDKSLLPLGCPIEQWCQHRADAGHPCVGFGWLYQEAPAMERGRDCLPHKLSSSFSPVPLLLILDPSACSGSLTWAAAAAPGSKCCSVQDKEAPPLPSHWAVFGVAT